MKNVLILGARGTLGSQLGLLYPEAAQWDIEDVNVLEFDALARRIDGLSPAPEAILNTVAFNDVDGAEDRREQAFALNAEFPGRLARYAAARGAALVHYSTNYVFDGVKGEYLESDEPRPLSSYGWSKLRGEGAVLDAGGSGYVVRTAVIFGPKGPSELSKRSFVDLMLDLATRRDVIQAVDDEVNSVTYAPDLAAATLSLVETAPEPGIYHLTNSGSASWCGFARQILQTAGKKVEVVPVPSSQFPRKATRPARAELLNTRRPRLRPWQEALAELLSGRERLS